MCSPCLPTAAFRRCSLIAFLITAAATLLPAQTVPGAASTPDQLSRYDANRNGRLDPDELAAMQAAEGATSAPVLLTPFQVSTEKDRGYSAGNTLSGSRADTPLAITPASISVMTWEFLDDFAITDMNESDRGRAPAGAPPAV